MVFTQPGDWHTLPGHGPSSFLVLWTELALGSELNFRLNSVEAHLGWTEPGSLLVGLPHWTGMLITQMRLTKSMLLFRDSWDLLCQCPGILPVILFYYISSLLLCFNWSVDGWAHGWCSKDTQAHPWVWSQHQMTCAYSCLFKSTIFQNELK